MKRTNSWYFLLIMILLYAVVFFVSPSFFTSSFNFFTKTALKIIPVFIFVFLLMVLVNRYVDNSFILKRLRGNKIKSWFFIILSGILSTGPMYMWYPLLKDLKSRGVTNGEIACFLYNRAIKPALLPLIILYFGLKYTVILSLVMIFLSLVQAFIIEKILPTKVLKENASKI